MQQTKKNDLLFNKESGIILHPTSLPGKFGIGEIGPEALRWLAMLEDMGQSLWQVLPLGPTGYGDSPYQNLSTFATNPLLISLEWLYEDGLLEREDLDKFPTFAKDHVDFGPVITTRKKYLHKATRLFQERAGLSLREGYLTFCQKHKEWLDEFALFSALKEAHALKSWTSWPAPLRDRDPEAMKAARETYETAIKEVKILQFLFDRQWGRIRAAAKKANIRIIGDIPIFVAHDSADAWANRKLFFLEETGEPTVIAGVPPDYFSTTGQRWGNPLYNWEKHKALGYHWWCARVHRSLDWVDVLRIDHFRGFASYWEIPAEEPTAVRGRWVPGPGRDLFEALNRELGELPIIAEDLGVITPEVEALRDGLQLPGMRILQFAFGTDPQKDTFLPENYPVNCVAYTGTHDNDTIVGWFHSEAGKDSTRTAAQIAEEQKKVLDYLGTDGSQIEWDFIEAVLKSNAGAALYPLQDVLGLSSEARMNIPAIPSGNWGWRFCWEQITDEKRKKLTELTHKYARKATKFIPS